MFTYDDQTSHGVSTIHTYTACMHLSRDQKIIINHLMPEIDQNVYVNNALSSSSHYCHSELRQVAQRKAPYLRTHFDRFQTLIIICGSCDKCIRIVKV